MKLNPHDGILELQPGQVLRLRAQADVTIACNGGTLWVTQEGRMRDDFLSAGDALGITSTGVTLVEAVGGKSASLTLRASRAPQPERGLRRTHVAF